MNKITFFISTIILFLLINIFSIKAFYNNFMWDYLFNKWSYVNSIEYFSNNNTIEWIYNKANVLYKQKKYDESMKEYMSILLYNDSNLEFKLNHNIANNYYRLWENEEAISTKISYRNKSIDYYRTWLDIRYDEETKQNLEYVLSKINELKEQDEENESSKNDNSEQNWWESNKDDNSESWEWEELEEWDKSDESWTWIGEEWGTTEWWEWSNQSWEENNISPEQSQALEDYQESLLEWQKSYADNFNKVYDENWDDDPFNNFFNNSLLNQWSDKKDW